MKKLLLILSLILIVGTLSAQNERANLMKLYGGVQIGRNGTGIGSTFVLDPNSLVHHIDSITFNSKTTPTLFKLYHGATQLNPDVPASFQVVAGTLQPMNADTGLVSITFGYGSGNAIDTTGIGFNSKFGAWRNDSHDTIIFTIVTGIVANSKNAATIPINIYHHATCFYATPDSVCDNHLTVTSTTTGTSTTTMEAKVAILPDQWVWCKPAHSLPVNGTIPSFLSVVATGHKQNRKW